MRRVAPFLLRPLPPSPPCMHARRTVSATALLASPLACFNAASPRRFSAAAVASSAAAAAASSAPLVPARTALLFPGQGSQRCGESVRALESEWGSIVRPVWQEMDETLKHSLSRVMRDSGASDELRATEWAQPAILAHSYAVWRVISTELGLKDASALCRVALGHSLGEYTALLVAGAIDFASAVRLVRRRGVAMQHATREGEGGMVALLCDTRSAGLHVPSIELLLEEARTALPDRVVQIANFNSPFQISISGHMDAVEYVKQRVNKPHSTERKANSSSAASTTPPPSPTPNHSASNSLTRGILRAVPLDVSGPFHSSLMRPAASPLSKALDAVQFRAPSVPVIFNAHAHPSVKLDRFPDYLQQQLLSPVLWHQSIVHAMMQMSVENFVELGPSTPLTSTLRFAAARLAAQAGTLDPTLHPAELSTGAARPPHPSLLPLLVPRPKVGAVDDGATLESKDAASILAGVSPAWARVRALGVSNAAEMRDFIKLPEKATPVEV